MKQYLCLSVVGLLTVAFAPNIMAEEPKTIGWIEHVQIQPNGLTLKAKIDTGADNSSVHAEPITVYEKEGAKWVKFSVANKAGEKADFDLPMTRYALIKRKGAEPLRRPVVTMTLCLGNTLKKVNINLANRENFKYRMLIGRSYLQDTLLVNSGKKHTVEPSCTGDNFAQR